MLQYKKYSQRRFISQSSIFLSKKIIANENRRQLLLDHLRRNYHYFDYHKASYSYGNTGLDSAGPYICYTSLQQFNRHDK